VALTDAELKIVMRAAENLNVEKRSLFLQRWAAQLSIRSSFIGRSRTSINGPSQEDLLTTS